MSLQIATIKSPAAISSDEIRRQDLREVFLQACQYLFSNRARIENFLQPSKKRPSTSSDDTMLSYFRSFCLRDIEMYGGDAKDYVRPSGSLSAEVGQLLHWPTPSTSGSIEFGETADPDSACVGRIISKGFDTSNSLFLEGYWLRLSALGKKERHKGMTPMTCWCEERRQTHEQLGADLMDLSSAKVWIVYGDAMRHTFIRTRSQNSDLLHGVVTLDLPDSLQLRARFALENRGASTVRIILFSPHPESIFYPSYSSKGQQLDFPLNIAACLTNIEVKPEYFEWFYKMLLQRNTDRFGAPLGGIIKQKQIESDNDRRMGFDELTKGTKDWLRSIHDIHNAADAETFRQRNGQHLSFLDIMMSRLFMESDLEFREKYINLSIRQKLRNSPFAFYYRFANDSEPAVVEIMCKKCNTKRLDHNPTFACSTGAYIIRQMVCKTKITKYCDYSHASWALVTPGLKSLTRRVMVRAAQKMAEYVPKTKKPSEKKAVSENDSDKENVL